mmetsp:Transcript_72875/g.194493  ORF Transcript_72875/g.194493 Transcript_72875/m.194493 type:complete len:242 (-) Transcript_72875:84-809(-)
MVNHVLQQFLLVLPPQLRRQHPPLPRVHRRRFLPLPHPPRLNKRLGIQAQMRNIRRPAVDLVQRTPPQVDITGLRGADSGRGPAANCGHADRGVPGGELDDGGAGDVAAGVSGGGHLALLVPAPAVQPPAGGQGGAVMLAASHFDHLLVAEVGDRVRFAVLLKGHGRPAKLAIAIVTPCVHHPSIREHDSVLGTEARLEDPLPVQEQVTVDLVPGHLQLGESRPLVRCVGATHAPSLAGEP